MISATIPVAARGDGKTLIALNGHVKLGGLVVLEHSTRNACPLVGGEPRCRFDRSDGEAQALPEPSEAPFEAQGGNRLRAAMGLAKDWRTGRMLRQIDAERAVTERECLLSFVGVGNAVDPDDGVTGIGSAGPFALAAEQAKMRRDDQKPARTAFGIGVITSERISMETVE